MPEVLNFKKSDRLSKIPPRPKRAKARAGFVFECGYETFLGKIFALRFRPKNIAPRLK